MELSILENNKRDHQTESQLNPLVDDNRLLRVGCGLSRSEMKNKEKHPVILTKGSHLYRLAILHHHHEVQHQGRPITNGAMRQAGLWIVGLSRMVNHLLRKCITCRRFRGKHRQNRYTPSFYECGLQYHWSMVNSYEKAKRRKWKF